MKLTKDNVRDFCKRKSKDVTIDGFEITIVEMTVTQQLTIESIVKDNKSHGELIAPVLKFCVVDDNNEPILDDSMIECIPAATAIKIFQECIQLNSISEQDLENRAKNS